MTLWAAYQHFEEKTKGSIEPGKVVDFVLLSENPIHINLSGSTTSRCWKRSNAAAASIAATRRQPDKASGSTPPVPHHRNASPSLLQWVPASLDRNCTSIELSLPLEFFCNLAEPSSRQVCLHWVEHQDPADGSKNARRMHWLLPAVDLEHSHQVSHG
jgi:hypothetical protein